MLAKKAEFLSAAYFTLIEFKSICYFWFSFHPSVSIIFFICYIYVCLCPPPDVPTTLPPSTTPLLHPIPPDSTAQLSTHASDPTDSRGTVTINVEPRAPSACYSAFTIFFFCVSLFLSHYKSLLKY